MSPAPFGRIPTSFFAGEPGSDNWRRDQMMAGYQFEHSFNKDLTFRQNARYAHTNVTFSSFYGNGYSGYAQLARNAFVTRANAEQMNLDNQLEYKFSTGSMRHTALLGVDVKHYTLDDYQAFGAAWGRWRSRPSISSTRITQAEECSRGRRTRTASQAEPGRRLSAGRGQIRSLHAIAHGPARLDYARQ